MLLVHQHDTRTGGNERYQEGIFQVVGSGGGALNSICWELMCFPVSMLTYTVSVLLDNQPGWRASLSVKRLLKRGVLHMSRTTGRRALQMTHN